MFMKKKFVAFVICLCMCLKIFGQNDQNEKILRIAQELTSIDTEEIVIKILGGGLTNVNYKVSVGDSSYFFRTVNNPNSILGSSLEREWLVTKHASQASIAPKVISYYPEDGVLVTEFIRAKSEKIDLRNKATMTDFCRTISFLHELKVQFPTEYDPYSNIENYLRSAHEIAVELPDTLISIVLPTISTFQKIDLSSLNIANVPAHLDLHSGNILDDGKQLWLIDWEYAAMADPYFDLATLTAVEKFSAQEIRTLLKCYLNRDPKEEELAHFTRMCILADTRWALWSFIQEKISPLDAPYRMYGNAYVEHALEQISELINSFPDVKIPGFFPTG